MSRLLIIVGLAALVTPAAPDWWLVVGGLAFGWGVTHKLFRIVK